MKKLILIITLFSAGAFAADFTLENTIPFQQATCKLGSSKVTLFLQFDKKISISENDFSGAPLVFLKGDTTIAVEPKPGDYSFVKPRGGSICDKTQAYPVTGTVAAIFYAKDNRPFQDKYMALIIDLKTEKVLEKKELGAVTDLFGIKGGFAYATIIPRSDADEIEVGAPSGRKIMATDQDLKAVQTAKLEGDNLKIAFDPTLSYQKSDWKPYFKTQDEYLKVAGWDSARGSFTNVIVYQGSHFNRSESDIQESCIAMTNHRGGKITGSDWRCLKEKR